MHIPNGVDGLLKFNDTLGSEGYNLLNRIGGFAGATANIVAYRITCRVEGPPKLDIAPCPHLAPPTSPTSLPMAVLMVMIPLLPAVDLELGSKAETSRTSLTLNSNLHRWLKCQKAIANLGQL